MVKKNKTNFNKKFIIISVVILVLALIIIGLLIKNKSSLTGEVISGNVIGITGNVVQGGECDVSLNSDDGELDNNRYDGVNEFCRDESDHSEPYCKNGYCGECYKDNDCNTGETCNYYGDCVSSTGGGGGNSCEWLCDPWSVCSLQGYQWRTCNDVNSNCNSDTRPLEQQRCTPDPNEGTCSDGIQNRDETGIDCGGSYCEKCFGQCKRNGKKKCVDKDNDGISTQFEVCTYSLFWAGPFDCNEDELCIKGKCTSHPTCTKSTDGSVKCDVKPLCPKGQLSNDGKSIYECKPEVNCQNKDDNYYCKESGSTCCLEDKNNPIYGCCSWVNEGFRGNCNDPKNVKNSECKDYLNNKGNNCKATFSSGTTCGGCSFDTIYCNGAIDFCCDSPREICETSGINKCVPKYCPEPKDNYNFCTGANVVRAACCEKAEYTCGITSSPAGNVGFCVPKGRTCDKNTQNYCGTIDSGENICCDVGPDSIKGTPDDVEKCELSTIGNLPVCVPINENSCDSDGIDNIVGNQDDERLCSGTKDNIRYKQCCPKTAVCDNHPGGLPFCNFVNIPTQ